MLPVRVVVAANIRDAAAGDRLARWGRGGEMEIVTCDNERAKGLPSLPDHDWTAVWAMSQVSEGDVRRTRGAQAPRDGAIIGVSRRHEDPAVTGNMAVDGTWRQPV